LTIGRAHIAPAIHITHTAAYACNYLPAAGWAGAQHYRAICQFLYGVFIGGECALTFQLKIFGLRNRRTIQG
jgi:hypothetical protein